MAFNIVSLSSGSKANCYYVHSSGTSILLDMGLCGRTLSNRARESGIDLRRVDAVLLTHSHSDHVKGAAAFLENSDAALYCHRDVAPVVLREAKGEINYIERDDFLEPFSIGEILVQPFRVSHDSGFTVGYVLRDGDDSLSLMTDTGYIGKKMFSNMEGVKNVLIESNHDIDMLKKGPYPPYLKDRILSDVGHLSNDVCSRAIGELAKRGYAEKFVLCHLSENNNTEALALSSTQNVLKQVGREDIPVLVANAKEPLFIK